MPATSRLYGAVHINMKKQLSIIIFVWVVALAGWTLASPPSGTIGTSVRSLFTDATGNVGIQTASPTTLLDINGTTTIRKSLDMAGNKIINVAAPTSGLDAVNKTYVDMVIGSMGPNIKLWGEGRPGAAVMTPAGNCTSTLAGPIIKISRSTRLATWDGAAAACPVGWWVCTAAERGTRACGTGGRNIMGCDTPESLNDDLVLYTGATIAWVSNTASSTSSDSPVTTYPYWGKMAYITAGNNTQNGLTCSLLPVWCCSY